MPTAISASAASSRPAIRSRSTARSANFYARRAGIICGRRICISWSTSRVSRRWSRSSTIRRTRTSKPTRSSASPVISSVTMSGTTSRAPACPTSRRRGICSNTPLSWKTARRACRGRRSPARRKASGRKFRISNGCEELLPPPQRGGENNMGGNVMLRRTVLKGMAAAAAGGFIARPAVAADTVLKIGMSMPLTGAGFAAVGRQLKAAIQLYMQQHGDTVAGRKIELTMRDDGGVADTARRTIQEMIVNDKVDIVGIGITPTALAIAPLVTEAKKATLVMSSGASITTTKSPYFVRAGFILSPQSWIMGEWAFKNGSKKVVTLVNDWAPGIEAETAFKTRFTQVGGEIVESIRLPLANPDFAPFLQRIADLKPDTAFIYFPGTQAPIFAKQFAERGLAK